MCILDLFGNREKDVVAFAVQQMALTCACLYYAVKGQKKTAPETWQRTYGA